MAVISKSSELPDGGIYGNVYENRVQNEFNKKVTSVIADLESELQRLANKQSQRIELRRQVIGTLISEFKTAQAEFYVAEPSSQLGQESDAALVTYQKTIKTAIVEQLASENMNKISRDHRNALMRLLITIYVKLFRRSDNIEQINPCGFWATNTAKVLASAKQQLNNVTAFSEPQPQRVIVSRA
jgi:hypothetical protein